MQKIHFKKVVAVFISWIMIMGIFPSFSVSAATDVSNLNPVDSTYALIKELEGCDLNCYWDVAQWTIGYGNKCPYEHDSDGTSWHQRGGHSITESEARALFDSKLSIYVNTLKSNCSGLSMTQNQFDALLSATYNHGNVNSCPLKYYLQGKLTESEAREQYYVWCINAGTKDETGLRNRRKKEADVFFGVGPGLVTPTINTDKGSYIVGDTVNISWAASPSGSNLDHYWLTIDSPSGTILNETMNRNTSYSFVVSQAGNYTITAFATPIGSKEGEGSLTDTKVINVVEPNPPTYSVLGADKTMLAVGEEITFNASSDYASGFTIGIDKDGSRVVTQDLNENSFTYQPNEEGNYYAYVTSWNGYGLCDSNGITFRVYDSKPTYSKINTDKTAYGINDDIIFQFESDTAIWYSVGIYKDGERIDSIWDVTDNTYTYHCTECGEYSAYVTSRNSLGWIDSERVNFTVYDSAPTYSNLEANKKRIAIGEKITFTASSDFAGEYWIGIDNEGSRYITQEMPNGQLTLSFDKAGSYSAYVTSSNSLGGKDSTLIYFMVYDPEKLQGDVNADGQFTVSDVVLLQKWILAVPNVELTDWKAADLCEDNRLDVFDLCLMKRMLIENN